MREAPSSIPDEMVVLGTALVSPERAENEISELVEDDFILPAHREIWHGMRAIANRKRVVDIIGLAGELGQSGAISRLEGGEGYLVTLAGFAVHPDILGQYVAKVREKSTARRLLLLCAETQASVYANRDIDEVICHARAQLGDLEAHAGREGPVTLGDVLPDVLANIEARQRSPHEHAIQTGLRSFDQLTGGLRPGKLVVVGGLPGMGKTAWAVNVCGFSASKGVPTLVVSLEMGREELAERWLSRGSHVPASEIASGAAAASRESMAAIFRCGGEVGEFPLWVDDQSRTLSRIVGNIRRWWVRNVFGKGHKLGLVAIDYLTLIKADGRSETRAIEVGEMSRSFKLLARELRIPVVLLSQLNRLAARENRRPIESDLRDSGAVEQDADMIIFPWREFPKDEMGNAMVNESGEAEWIVAKNRQGPKGTARCYWQAPEMGFYDVEDNY